MEGKNYGSPSFINVAVLLLFAIVIAVVSAVTTYFVLNSRSNEQYSAVQPPIIIPRPQTNVLPTSIPTTESQTVPDETANWKVYRNEKYGFTLKFPVSWRDYRVHQLPNDMSPDGLPPEIFRFGLPTKSEKWPDYDGYADLFAMSIHTPQSWSEVLESYAQEGRDPPYKYVYKNNKYVVSFTLGQDCAEDLCDKRADFQNIVPTFKFLD